MARRSMLVGVGCLLASSVSALGAAAAPQLQAAAPVSREYQIKAAFLYHFAQFVEWPSGAFDDRSSAMFLCVLGTDPFGPELESLEGKQIRGRRVEIMRLDPFAEPDQCHILFISLSETTRVAEIVASLENKSILTVGDMQGFAQMGGVINFAIRRNKIRFQINRDAGDRAGLVISSRLLSLATIVEDRSPAESD